MDLVKLEYQQVGDGVVNMDDDDDTDDSKKAFCVVPSTEN